MPHRQARQPTTAKSGKGQSSHTAADAVELADFQLERGPDIDLGMTFQFLLEKAEAPEFLGTLD